MIDETTPSAPWDTMITVSTGRTSLMVNLTHDEVFRYSQDSAVVQGEVDDVEAEIDQIKARAAALKKSLGEKQATLRVLAFKIRHREESRNVATETVTDLGERRTYVVRLDTGDILETMEVPENEQSSLSETRPSRAALEAMGRHLHLTLPPETDAVELTMAENIKAMIHAVEDGLALVEVVFTYREDQELQDKAERTVRALLNLEEIEGLTWPDDDDFILRAALPVLIHDVERMVELYPDLETDEDWDPGNEASFAPIFKPVPLAEMVRDHVSGESIDGNVGDILGDHSKKQAKTLRTTIEECKDVA